MKNLRKTTVTNAENNMLVQKFEKKTWKKLMKTKKIFKTWELLRNPASLGPNLCTLRNPASLGPNL